MMIEVDGAPNRRIGESARDVLRWKLIGSPGGRQHWTCFGHIVALSGKGEVGKS